MTKDTTLMHTEEYLQRQEFKSRLLAALKDLGVTDRGKGAWLSNAMKVTPKAASKWLTGESIPHSVKWKKLAKLLKKPEAYFFTGSCVEASSLSIAPYHTLSEDEQRLVSIYRELPGSMQEKAHLLLISLK